MTILSYELGQRVRFSAKVTSPIAFTDKKSIEGIVAYARDERTGEYVRVYEVAAEEWVDGMAQSHSSGNFGTIENARKFASKAYRYINRK